MPFTSHFPDFEYSIPLCPKALLNTVHMRSFLATATAHLRQPWLTL